jgi:hypothetical protein
VKRHDDPVTGTTGDATRVDEIVASRGAFTIY